MKLRKVILFVELAGQWPRFMVVQACYSIVRGNSFLADPGCPTWAKARLLQNRGMHEPNQAPSNQGVRLARRIR
jgi:hypothetical protein